MAHLSKFNCRQFAVEALKLKCYLIDEYDKLDRSLNSSVFNVDSSTE